MKNILTLLIFLPALIYSQERQQKLNLRSNAPISSPSSPRTYSQPAPSYQQQRIRSGVDSYSESQQKQSYRRSQKEENTFHSGGNRYHYYDTWRYDPYWNWNYGWNDWWIGPNRWNRWGAPYMYDYWYRDYYFDRWGYRQPMRLYVQENGKIDTVKGVKQKFSIGLQANTSEIGGFLTIGRKTFFVLEYQHRYQKDRSVYYPDLTRDVVLPWEDKRENDIKKGGTLFLGLGERFGKTSVFGALGIVNEKVRYQYYDEMFILSNNGYYSLPSFRDRYLAMKLGVMQDLKTATIKADYEPTRNLVTIGLGVNF